MTSGDNIQGDKIGGDKVGGDKVLGDQWNINYYQPATTPLDRQQQRNRKAMLQKVKAIWIDGLLEQSLAKELRIALDLTTQPDAVNLPLNALVQELNRPAHPLAGGTPIIKVLTQMGAAYPGRARCREDDPSTGTGARLDCACRTR